MLSCLSRADLCPRLPVLRACSEHPSRGLAPGLGTQQDELGHSSVLVKLQTTMPLVAASLLYELVSGARLQGEALQELVAGLRVQANAQAVRAGASQGL